MHAGARCQPRHVKVAAFGQDFDEFQLERQRIVVCHGVQIYK